MYRHILATLTAIILFSFHAGGQPLPQDPRITKGTMPNGLTYYIAKDEHSGSGINLSLVQKSGYMVENRWETGFSELIGKLALRGTRNFPDSSMIRYFLSEGIRRGYSLSVETGAESTLFRINDIPAEHIDTALLILYDWSCFINIDDDDIDSEEIYNRERNIYSLQKRIIRDCDYISVLENNDIPAASSNPHSINIKKNIGSKALRNFYYRWYRPDLQAIIISGNVDPAAIESKIRSLFASIPKSRYNDSPTCFSGIYEDSVEVNMISNPNISEAELSFTFVAGDISDEDKASAASYLQEYMTDVFSDMFKYRIREASAFTHFPIYDIKVEKRRLLKEEGAFLMTVRAKINPDFTMESVSFLAKETARTIKYGFTEGEFSMASSAYMEKLKKAYMDRKKFNGFGFGKMCTENFLYGTSLSSIELKYTMMSEMVPEIDIESFNIFATSLVNPENCSISLKLPVAAANRHISEENVRNAYYAGRMAETISYLDKEIKAPLFRKNADLKKEYILYESVEPVSGASVWHLSNGAAVVLLNNDLSDATIKFKAFKKGGASEWKGNTAGLKVLEQFADFDGVSNLNRVNLERYVESKGMSILTTILPDASVLEGSTSPERLENFVRLINQYFTERKADDQEYYRFLKRTESEIRFRDRSIKYELFKGINNALYSNYPVNDPITKDDLEDINYLMISEFVRDIFSGASGFTFVFTGKYDKERFASEILRYIASIPAGEKSASGFVRPWYLNKKDTEEIISTGKPYFLSFMDMNLLKVMNFNIENAIYADMVSLLMSDIMGGVRITPEFHIYPENILRIGCTIGVSNGDEADTMRYINDRLYEMSVNGISTEIFNSIIKTLRTRYQAEQMNNEYWMNILYMRYMYGTDMHSKRDEIINNATADKLQNFLLDILTNGNKISVILK